MQPCKLRQKQRAGMTGRHAGLLTAIDTEEPSSMVLQRSGDVWCLGTRVSEMACVAVASSEVLLGLIAL